ncbi:uncharacterized protein [Periplaneta americana]|uniref:uncharacterized protein n=1 Tax=Periplaneta americana TaxID=6978 RepID=UPI0037E8AD7E
MGKSKLTPTNTVKSETKGKTNEKNQGKHLDKNKPAVQYLLSDPKFIDLGWTMVSGEKPGKRIITYATRPSRPVSIWTPSREESEVRFYENGKKFTEFLQNGNANVYYPNGRLAITYRKREDGYIVEVTQPGGRDEGTGIPRKPSLAGLFDSMGNGVLYDYSGNIRVNFTQREGVLMDTPNKRPVRWRWQALSHMNEFQDETRDVLTRKEVYSYCEATNSESNKELKNEISIVSHLVKSSDSNIWKKEDSLWKMSRDKNSRDADSAAKKGSRKLSAQTKDSKGDLLSENRSSAKVTKLSRASRTPLSQGSEEKPISRLSVMDLAVMLQNQKGDKHPATRVGQAKRVCSELSPIVLRINQYLSLRIMDQANISLRFTHRKHQIRLELGVVVDSSFQVRTDVLEPEEAERYIVPCAFETFLKDPQLVKELATLRSSS